MPVKNSDPWIKECLESILEQSYSNWELLAINDHSTDHSLSILKQYALSDLRIKVLNNRGKGILDALQYAFELSNGDYVTRMDADDKMPSNKLNDLLENINGSDNVLSTGLVKYFSKNEVSVGYKMYENWINERNTLGDYDQHIYREWKR